MGVAASTSVLTEHNRMINRFTGPQSVDEHSSFWDELLSFPFCLTKLKTQDVEEHLRDNCSQLAINTFRTGNFGKLVRHALASLRETFPRNASKRDDAKSSSSGAGAVPAPPAGDAAAIPVRAVNSLYLVRIFLKYYLETGDAWRMPQFFHPAPGTGKKDPDLGRQLVRMLLEYLAFAPVTSGSYLLHLEAINALLVLSSTQLYSAMHVSTHGMLDIAMEQSDIAAHVVQRLLTHYTTRTAAPARLPLYTPPPVKAKVGYLRRVSSAAATVLLLPYHAYHFIFSQHTAHHTAPVSPLADLSLLLLLVLVHYGHSEHAKGEEANGGGAAGTGREDAEGEEERAEADWHGARSQGEDGDPADRNGGGAVAGGVFGPDPEPQGDGGSTIPTKRTLSSKGLGSRSPSVASLAEILAAANPFRSAIASLRDSEFDVEDPEGNRIAPQGSLCVSYRELYDTIGMCLVDDRSTLLLYTLIHGNPAFLEYVLVRGDLDTLLLPLLEMLYHAPQRTPNQIYMLLIILLILSQDASFNANVHKLVLASVPWYNERLMVKISLGSLMVIILIRTVKYNLSQLRDVYLHTNCLAALANMAPHMHNLNSYAAQRLVSLFDMLARKYLRLAEGSRNLSHGVLPDGPDAAARNAAPGGRASHPDHGAHDHRDHGGNADHDHHDHGHGERSGNAAPFATLDVAAVSLNSDDAGRNHRGASSSRGDATGGVGLSGTGPSGMDGVPGGDVTGPSFHGGGVVSSDNVPTELHIYTDFLRIVLEIVNAILSYALPRNPEMVYALLHRQELFIPFRHHPRFKELLDNLYTVLDYFNVRMDDAHIDGEWSVEKVLSVVTATARGWKGDGIKMFPELRFTYEEEMHPEEFFVPYVWSLVCAHSGIPWLVSSIALFPAEASLEEALTPSHSHSHSSSRGSLTLESPLPQDSNYRVATAV
eukprot:jgi/Mesvir1/6570/Mv25657-RA.1